jgi:hypothetical protein
MFDRRTVSILFVVIILLACWDCDKKPTGISQEASDYADIHWIESKYIDDRQSPTDASWYGYWDQWYQEYALDEHLSNVLSHALPEERDRDYYEMIGKYDQFVYGWDDVHGPPLNLLPGDSTLAPYQDIVIWSGVGLDTVHFEPYIPDVVSQHRDAYLDMIGR